MGETIEGHVEERHDDLGFITATLIDSSGWSYYAEIDINRFSALDQPLLQPGVLFLITEPGPELKVRRK